jgi:hypothetical protein
MPTKTLGIINGNGVELTVRAIPANNPNHLHITARSPQIDKMKFGWTDEDGFISTGSPCFYPGAPYYPGSIIMERIGMYPGPGFCTLWGSHISIPKIELSYIS